jgi:hypothetical protein
MVVNDLKATGMWRRSRIRENSAMRLKHPNSQEFGYRQKCLPQTSKDCPEPPSAENC